MKFVENVFGDENPVGQQPRRRLKLRPLAGLAKGAFACVDALPRLMAMAPCFFRSMSTPVLRPFSSVTNWIPVMFYSLSADSEIL